MIKIEIVDLSEPNKTASRMIIYKYEWKVASFTSHFPESMMQKVAKAIKNADDGKLNLFTEMEEINAYPDDKKKLYIGYFNDLIKKAYARHVK